jgi:hypothetical protein
MPRKPGGKPQVFKIRPDGKNDTGSPRVYKTANDLEDKINEYFGIQDKSTRRYKDKEDRQRIIVTGSPYMYLELKLHCFNTNTSAQPYENGIYDEDPRIITMESGKIIEERHNYSVILARGKDKCHINQYKGAIIGALDSRMVALNLQSNYGYSTKQDITADVTAKAERPQTVLELTDALAQLKLKQAEEQAQIAE